MHELLLPTLPIRMPWSTIPGSQWSTLSGLHDHSVGAASKPYRPVCVETRLHFLERG